MIQSNIFTTIHKPEGENLNPIHSIKINLEKKYNPWVIKMAYMIRQIKRKASKMPINIYFISKVTR